jgi:hypothetical protein
MKSELPLVKLQNNNLSLEETRFVSDCQYGHSWLHVICLECNQLCEGDNWLLNHQLLDCPPLKFTEKKNELIVHNNIWWTFFLKIGNVTSKFTKNELIVHNNTWWTFLKIGNVTSKFTENELIVHNNTRWTFLKIGNVTSKFTKNELLVHNKTWWTFLKIGNVPLRFTKNELIVHNNTWWRLLKIGNVPWSSQKECGLILHNNAQWTDLKMWDQMETTEFHSLLPYRQSQ